MTWYKDGLRFSCTQCGKCCTGGPGYVWVTDAEIIEMAAFIKMPVEEFVPKYIRTVGEKKAIKERGPDYDCVFLKNKLCQVYGSRPRQCRKFPWWEDTLKSKEAWEEEGKRCEGMSNPEAPLITFEEIQKHLSDK